MSRIGRPVSASPTFVEDCRVVSIKDLSKPYGDSEEITRSCGTCGHIERTEISIVQTRRGPRLSCVCGALLMKLYQPPGYDDWRCRRYLDLVYKIQYKKGKKDPVEELIERYQPSLESYLPDDVRELSAKIDSALKVWES